MNLGMEDECTEFKRSTSELREGCESIASILNKHGGGKLYFGVKPDGDVIGQDVSERTLRHVSQTIGNKIEPVVYPDIHKLDDGEGHEYIEVVFSGTQTPYQCEGRYRIRRADEDVIMTAAEVSRFAAQSYNRTNPWDGRPSGRPVSDVVSGIVESFVRKGAERGRITEPYTNDADVLERLGLVAADDTLTNAAVELFCRSTPYARIKMGVLAGNDKVDIVDLRQEEGPILDLVRQAELFVLTNIRRRIVIDGKPERDEIPEIPQPAVREAIVNALCHREYGMRGMTVDIDIFMDTVEITNPGLFPVGDSPEDHLTGRSHKSDSPNPLIAAALFRAGIIEAYGSGIPRIKSACDEADVRFEYHQRDGQTRLVFHRQPPVTRQGEPATSTTKLPTLTDRERLAISLAANNGHVTVSMLQNAAGLGRRTASKTLRALAERDALRWHGSGKSDPRQYYSLPRQDAR